MQQMHIDSWYWGRFVLPISRFSEFGSDGGPAATSLKPKFHVFSNHLSTLTGAKLPEFEVSIWFSQCQLLEYAMIYYTDRVYLQIQYLVAGAIALKALGSLLFIFGSSFGAYLLVRALNLFSLFDSYAFLFSPINSRIRVVSLLNRFCTKLSSLRYCMTSTTTTLRRRNSLSSSPSLPWWD